MSDFNETIKQTVEKEVMQAINDLGVRSVVREQIIETGLTKEQIKTFVDETIDAYIRSAIGENIIQMIRNKVDSLISQAVEKEIKKEIGYSEWRGSEIIRKLMIDQLDIRLRQQFSFSLKIDEKIK